MKIALAQINTSMGAIDHNRKKVDRFLDEAQKLGADLTIFPELTLVGYPPKDLLLQEGFVASNRVALDQLASSHPRKNFIVGFVEEAKTRHGKGLFNAAAFVSEGKIATIYRKRLLPNYDVFDESRYFDPGHKGEVVVVTGERVAITICEDIWNDAEILGKELYSEKPMKDLKALKADLVINLSASPYHNEQVKLRHKLVENLVRAYHMPMVYVNLVGTNDELLLDGGSFAMDGQGTVLARARVFQEDLILFDTKKGRGDLRPWPTKEEEWQSQALIMGIHDYVKKCGFQKVVVGLSGGIDSSLVALLAFHALGAENVTGISMPSRFTGVASREDAETLAKKLGIQFLTIPIEPMVKAFEDSLAGAFADKPRDVTEENIQARVRGILLMAFSNKFGQLVLSTGNKSEMAVGYCTQYGDMVGGLSVISDLPKGEVYRMAKFLNEEGNLIPQRVLNRAPSAELRPNQKDEDSLPSYDVLDPILQMYIEEQKSPETIIQSGFDPAIVKSVVELVDRNEFKRRQAAPGLRLSAKAFGIGRRMPICRGPI